MYQMPAKYPVDIQSFAKIREGNYLYVDKTDLVYHLANSHNCVFLSRPRRFGKSLLTSTIEAYFKGQKELFKGLLIENLESEWRRHPVLHFDLSGENFNHPQRMIDHISNILLRMEEQYQISSDGSISQRFTRLIHSVYKLTGERIVILIDEYDKPLLDNINGDGYMEDIQDELRAFYSVIKSCDAYLRFSFLTGVTRFSRLSVFSGLNNLDDISLRPDYNAICGITEKEMHTYFTSSVDVFADFEGRTPDEIWHELKERYDGYHFSRIGEDIYNPISVMKTFEECDFRDYWFDTGQPSFLFKLITRHPFNVGQLDGARRTASMLCDISNIDTDIVPLLYQAGYLSIKSYDRDRREYVLGFPNKEVSLRFWESLAKYFFPGNVENGNFSLRHFTEEINNGNAESLMILFQSLLADTPSEHEMNKEVHFQNMMAIVAKMLGYCVETERHSSHGRCDMILKTTRYIYIFEFKVDGTPQQGISQIFEKGYADPYGCDPRSIFLVGANFSSKTRTLDSWLIQEYNH